MGEITLSKHSYSEFTGNQKAKPGNASLGFRHAIGAIVCFIVLVIGFLFLLPMIPKRYATVSLLSFQELAYVVSALLMVFLAKDKVGKVFPLQGNLNATTIVLLGVLGGASLLMISGSTFSRLYNPAYVKQVAAMMQQIQSVIGIIPLLILTGVLFPICEEVFFRGTLFVGVQNRFRSVWALLFSSVIFGLFHINPVHMAVAFTLGVYCGLLRLLTGSLLVAIVAHIANNVLGMLMVVFWPSYQLPLWVCLPGFTMILGAFWWLKR